MTKIILASNSPQRKKLLKYFGLKFSVRPSNVDEIMKITSTCSSLVKKNAELKAMDVASRAKEGIVIGSDSVVYLGGKKIIGKPRSLKEAKKNLKKLFATPHWVYTGVAIVDAKTGRKLVDHEKTKIFMTSLSDKEIDRYHKIVDPSGKAGGFDIEGWGSIFIRRIEGCYSNVIGLPMAKTAKMLKKFGISVLSLLLMFSMLGCATEYNLATGREERLMFTTEKEIKVGENVAAKFEEEYEMVSDIDMNDRIESIFSKLVAVSDRTELVYFIKIIDDDALNAVSLPGGYVYINKGLVEELENDDQIAGVIAHELGHITAKHGMKRLQAMYGAVFLQLLSSTTNAGFARGVNTAIATLFSANSQEDEMQADRLGLKYMVKAGYDKNQMLEVLYKLKDEHEKAPIRRFGYLRSHPHLPKRIAAVNVEITGQMRYRDYINLVE